ncbi:MAG TPA: TetR/AcrR family transcriptional regulator [Pseudolysinimonas sp.]|nr:TetR/AcrR family transcriptional regulator [Pseudolysinimonas sp.]
MLDSIQTAPTDRWDAFRAQQRDDIATAIIEAVAAGSTEQLSVSNLVDRAGISRKTFYKYFDDVGAALVYTHERVLRHMGENWPVTTGDRANHREMVLEMLANIELAARRSPHDFAYLAFFDFVAAGRTRSGDEAAFDNLMRAQQQGIIDTFISGQAEGSIRLDLDPETTIWAISNATFGLVQRSLVIGLHGEFSGELSAAMKLVIQSWRELLTPKSV